MTTPTNSEKAILDLVQTSEPVTAAGIEPARLKRHGLTIVKRPNNKGQIATVKYTCRIKFRKKVYHLTLAETAKKSFEMAVAARREIQEGRWDQLRQQVGLRHLQQTNTHDLFVVYRRFKGPDRPAETTLELNIHALTAITREVLGETVKVEDLPLSSYTAELLWKWKEQKRKLAGDAPNDERALQILRSANSRLRQARSIFSDNEELRTFYRQAPTLFPELKLAKIEIPDSIAGFCAEPPFSDCSKEEYHAPPDHIIARTFAALEKLGQSTNEDDLNMFKACWLAIGFGLRKGDINQCCNDWFQKVDGAIFCRGDVLAKNKKFPEVRCQLDAWARLGPLIEGKDPKAHVLTGTKTERCDTVFRRISDWMRGLGWETTHHVHEFRAWAGCQIAMAPGNDIRTSQVFMRHKHFTTTEKFYGHHIKIKLGEVKLTIPEVTPKQFTPVVLPAAEQTA